jgi:dienelactone hydrolase
MLMSIIKKNSFSIIFLWLLAINVKAGELSANKHLLNLLKDVKCQEFLLPDVTSGFSEHAEGQYQIKDIQFPACDGKKVTAYLVKPQAGIKSKGAILYVHWLDPSADDSNRNEFLSEAKTLAAKGFTSLLVSTFWSIPGGFYMERRWQDDYQNTLYQLKDLQHATVVLKSIPKVKTKNLIYVGHDYGATFGAMLLGVDHSFKSAVLMAGIAVITDWYTYGSATGVPEGKALAEFKQQFSKINPDDLIQFAKADLFFQYSNKDQFISQAQAEALYKKAPAGYKVSFYDVDHSLKIELANKDRLGWIESQK